MNRYGKLLKKIYFLLAVSLLLVQAAPASAARFVSSSPYVNTVISFISGTKAGKGRAAFVALNEKELRRRGGVRLFKDTDVSQDEILRSYYDPARIPYVAHAVMRIASTADNANYKYYQRRLAEFQAALDSAVDIGRYCLPGNVVFLDLTGVEGALISSAHDATVRPDKSEWKRWESADTESLKKLVEMSEQKGTVILVDGWTPPQVNACLVNYKKKIYLPRAETGENYFNSLMSIYRYAAKRLKYFKDTNK